MCSHWLLKDIQEDVYIVNVTLMLNDYRFVNRYLQKDLCGGSISYDIC